jgi:general secretion pathway protein J
MKRNDSIEPVRIARAKCPARPARLYPKADRPLRGFTLIEILLAVTIFAIVLLAINTVFYTALKLERGTYRSLDERLPLNQALGLLRRDLQGAVPPLTNSAILVTDFRASGGGGLASSQAGSLEFYTTTGSLREEEPWGDLQKVRYELVEPTAPNNAAGLDLVRTVTRNILPVTTAESTGQWLMGGVERLEFQCFNGTDWRETWDTTMGDTGLPLAVRVRLLLAVTNGVTSSVREPLELLVPLITQMRTNPASGGSGG